MQAARRKSAFARAFAKKGQKMRAYPFDEFESDVKVLAKRVQAEFMPEVILAVARGGLTLGHFLAMRLNNRRLFVLNSIHYDDTQRLDELQIFNVPDLSEFRKVLIVDDMIDSGETMSAIKSLLQGKFPQCEFKVATIFYKQNVLFKPDFTLKEAKEWIEFFWEKL